MESRKLRKPGAGRLQAETWVKPLGVAPLCQWGQHMHTRSPLGWGQRLRVQVDSPAPHGPSIRPLCPLGVICSLGQGQTHALRAHHRHTQAWDGALRAGAGSPSSLGKTRRAHGSDGRSPSAPTVKSLSRV